MKRETGSATFSPGLTTLGAVTSIISGSLTSTDFSAMPNALSLPAITIVLTDPVYWGKCNSMSIGFPCSQSERSKEFYNRYKSPCFIGRFINNSFISSDGKYPFKSSAESSKNKIIKIPGLDTKCFAGIEIVPWIRSLETWLYQAVPHQQPPGYSSLISCLLH